LDPIPVADQIKSQLSTVHGHQIAAWSAIAGRWKDESRSRFRFRFWCPYSHFSYTHIYVWFMGAMRICHRIGATSKVSVLTPPILFGQCFIPISPTGIDIYGQEQKPTAPW